MIAFDLPTCFKLALCLIAGSLLAACSSKESTTSLGNDDVVELALRDMCDRKLVVLGEPADHGGGKNTALKVSLVKRLVEQCDFDTILFEAGFYDFARIYQTSRRDSSVTSAEISSSVGGLWNQSAEFAPLPAYLAANMNSGDIVVGGIDDNLGSAGAFYSIDTMPDELSQMLDGKLQPLCKDRLKQLIYYSYGPVGPQKIDTENVNKCLDTIARSVASDSELPVLERSIFAQNVKNIRTYNSRILEPRETQLQAREDAFFDNYWWWLTRRPANAKVIIWGASVHMSKANATFPPYSNIKSFGTQLYSDYDTEMFVLSFTAKSGFYHRAGDGQPKAIPVPAEDALENIAPDTPGYSYLGPADLATLGRKPVSSFRRAPTITHLARTTDGIIIIHEEAAPLPRAD